MTDRDIDELNSNQKTGLPLTSYGGCVSKDQLGKMVAEPKKYWIVNLDDSTGKGTHWCLLSSLNPHTIVWADPFATPPPEAVLEFMRRAKDAQGRPKKMVYSTSQIQDLSSSYCGYLCCFLAYRLRRGATLLTILESLDVDFKAWRNDILMKRIRTSGLVKAMGRKW